MKILMVLESFFPPDTRVENEIETLTNNGHEVEIVCYDSGKKNSPDKFKNAKIHKVKISNFRRKTSVGALFFPFYFSFWRKVIFNLCVKTKYDAIHIHDLQLAKIGYEVKTKYETQFILDLHENWPALLSISEHTKSFLGNLLFSLNRWMKYEKKYTNLADKIIVVVDESKKRIEALGVKSDKIHIVSNTLNIDEFDFIVNKKKTSHTIFTYAGGITYHRGLQYVIEACSNMKSNHYEVWIIGSGRYLKTLKQKVNDLDLNNRIKFFGWQERSQLLKSITESDVALIPHIKSAHTDSTIPHKLFQYMYAEIPILASNCSPIERILKESSSGIIYPYSSVPELAEIMDKIVNNDFELTNFKKGKSFVINKYNWANDGNNLLELYLQ